VTPRQRRRSARARTRLDRRVVRSDGLRASQSAAVRTDIKRGYANATSGWKRCACGRWKPCLHCAQAKRARAGDQYRHFFRLGAIGDQQRARKAKRAEKRDEQRQTKYQRRHRSAA
jgi:hypothetical protein